MFSQLKFEAASRPCAALPDSSASSHAATTRGSRPVSSASRPANFAWPEVRRDEFRRARLHLGSAVQYDTLTRPWAQVVQTVYASKEATTNVSWGRIEPGFDFSMPTLRYSSAAGQGAARARPYDGETQ